MRTLITSLAVALLIPTFVQFAAAGDPDQAGAVVEKAIEAAGGRKNLEKFTAMTWKETGTYYGMGEGLPYTSKGAFSYPDKSFMEIEGFFSMGLNGDKGWVKMGEDVTDMPEDQLKGQMEAQYASWAATLLPLKGEGFALKSLEDADLNGKPAAVVQVSHKGHGDVKLYFDKKTGRLAKSAFTAYDSEQAKDADYETWYDGYKEMEGAKLACKIVMNRDGKKFVVGEITEVKPAKPEAIAKMFEKP